MEVFERILQLLQEQEKEQKQLYEYLGVSSQKYFDWKAGRIKSYTKYLDKIAEFFGVSVDYLLGKDEIKNRSISEEMERIYKIIQDDPELKEYVERYLNLSPEGRAQIRQFFDLIARADNSKS